MTRDGNRDPRAAPHNAYPCAGEDRWCVIAVFEDVEWRALCRVMDRSALCEDERFATLARRKENEEALDRIIGEWTRNLPAETVMIRLQQAGVAAGIVASAEDMHNDPQFRHRDHFLYFDHPAMGRHPVDALPPKLSKTPARQYSHDPCLGEHNAHVCTELLGMPDEEFVKLIAENVFE
jgi:crotonobetainyl-CoA:carnitine CoA-transferase CaiB-like acyl-CoA transferase